MFTLPSRQICRQVHYGLNIHILNYHISAALQDEIATAFGSIGDFIAIFQLAYQLAQVLGLG